MVKAIGESERGKMRLLKNVGDCAIIASGKIDRRLSSDREDHIKGMVKFLNKSFYPQKVRTVYLNENLNDSSELHSIAFVFRYKNENKKG